MALAAEPFSFLDKQTHNPITDLSSITDSKLYNTAKNAFTQVSAAVKDLIGSIKDKFAALSGPINAIKDMAGQVKNAVQNAIDGVTGTIRNVMSGINSLKDMASAGLQALEDAIYSMLPAGVSRGTISSLARKCKESVAGSNVLGKPWDINGACGTGGTGSCTGSSISNLLNSLTGGAYNSAWKDVNALLSGLVGLTNLSYNANMCGVFGMLAGQLGGQLNVSQLARAAGTVVGVLGTKGNLLGLADISKQVQGMNIGAIVPSALNSMSSNVGSFSEKRVTNVSERGLAGYELIDGNWAGSQTSSGTGLGLKYSNRNMTNPSEGFTNVLQAGTMSNKVTNVNSFDNSTVGIMYSQAKAGVSKVTSSVSSAFNSLFG